MLARQQQQLGKKQQRAAPAPVISGIQRLDNILDDQNVQRSIDKAAQQLEEFVAKNRDDQRTVLLGLPAIMGALLGGGPQNNAFSWLDEFRSRRTASIVNSTFVDIYTETANDVLAELIFRHGSTACGEYQQRKSKSGTGSYGTRSSPRHHPTMLLLARSESRQQLARGSLFNVVFRPRVSLPCTFQFDANNLPASIRPAINAHLRGETAQIERMPALYHDILHRTDIALQNRFQGGRSRFMVSNMLELTPREFFLFSFFHYPVAKDRGNLRPVTRHGGVGSNGLNRGLNGRLGDTGGGGAFPRSGGSGGDSGGGGSSFSKQVQMRGAGMMSGVSMLTGMGGSRNTRRRKRDEHDYLAQAPLREIMHDDTYCLLVHQYCEFFLPLSLYDGGGDDEDLFLQVLIQFWLRQGYRPIRNVGAITGFSHRAGMPMGPAGAGAAAFNVKPTNDQICALVVFLTHVLVRDHGELKYPNVQSSYNSTAKPVLPQTTADGYNFGMSPTIDRLARPLYDFFWQSLNEASHGNVKPTLSKAIDLWLTYIQPWRAHDRAGLPPRTANQRKGQLGQDLHSVAAARIRSEAHNTRGSASAARKTAAALRARRADVGPEWVGFIVQNYCFYIEMLNIVVERVHRSNFNMVDHGTGDLLLLERILAVYTPNVRAILQECRMYLEIYHFSGAVAGPERQRLERATLWLDRRRDSEELFVSVELGKLLKEHYHKIEPDLAQENMPSVGFDLIQYLSQELNRATDRSNSASSKSIGTRLREYYAGLKGPFTASEPTRDPAGFITNQGRMDILGNNNYSTAAHWNAEYGPQAGRAQAPCSFMREIYGKDQTVLRLIPRDPMLRPVRLDEARILVWPLVRVSRWINSLFGWHYRWIEYVKVDCHDEEWWLPIYPEQRVVRLKVQIMKKLVQSGAAPAGLSLASLVLTCEGSKLNFEDDRLCDLDIHHDSQIDAHVIGGDCGGLAELKKEGKNHTTEAAPSVQMAGGDGAGSAGRADSAGSAGSGGRGSAGRAADSASFVGEVGETKVTRREDGTGAHPRQHGAKCVEMPGSKELVGVRGDGQVATLAQNGFSNSVAGTEEGAEEFTSDPWLEEPPAGAFGAYRAGNRQQGVMSSWNAKDNNLHAELRINRLQRMIHILFEVQGDAPKSLAAKGKKSGVGKDKKKNADTSNDRTEGSNNSADSQMKGQGVPGATPRVVSVRRGRKRPQWESGALPVCGRVNLRPLASFFGIVIILLAVVVLWFKFSRATTEPRAQSQALARYRL
jgi:hypothetical protein